MRIVCPTSSSSSSYKSVCNSLTQSVLKMGRDARSLLRFSLVSSLVILVSACAPLESPPASNDTSTTVAQTSAGTVTTPSSGNCVDSNSEYRIGVGDNLAINVWRNKDLSVTVPVRPDGKISVPLAGDVEVGEKTPEEVSAAITQKLAKYIRDPFVTVIVTDMNSNQFKNRVRVTGAVQRPVSLPYRDGMTVLDVVLEAGGTNEFANLSNSSLFRCDGTRLDHQAGRHRHQLPAAPR